MKKRRYFMHHGRIRNFELVATFGLAAAFMAFAIIALILMKVI